MTTAYDIRALPVSPVDSEIRKFAALRLLALKTDPASFGSTYEREIAFTEHQWRERLSTDKRATFIAAVVDPDSDQEWVATTAVLTPSEMTFDALAPLRNIGVGKDGHIYILVGMWVRPEYRRRGLGKRMIEEVFEWVRRDGTVWKDKFVALQVSENNDSGWALYGKMGFELLSEVESEHKWMLAHVD